MQKQASRADSKIAANEVTKIPSTCRDVIADLLQNQSISHQVADTQDHHSLNSSSVDSKISQQSQEKREERDCEIQGSQEGIHTLRTMVDVPVAIGSR